MMRIRSIGGNLVHGLAALCACAAIACAGDKPNAEAPSEQGADSHYDVAVGSFHNGMYEDAKLQLDRALQVDPQHAESHYLRGVLLLNEGKTIVDSIEIEQCLTDAASLQQRARAEELHQQAGQAFAMAASTFEDDAAGRGRALNSMSVVDLFFQRYEAAADSAKNALGVQFYTDRYSALANLGWAHYLQGDLVSATAELRQAILLNAHYCVGHYRLAQVYLDAGVADQALEHASIVTTSERCPIQDAYRIAGVAERRLGRDVEATAALDECVAVAPRSCLAQDCLRLQGGEKRATQARIAHAE